MMDFFTYCKEGIGLYIEALLKLTCRTDSQAWDRRGEHTTESVTDQMGQSWVTSHVLYTSEQRQAPENAKNHWYSLLYYNEHFLHGLSKQSIT